MAWLYSLPYLRLPHEGEKRIQHPVHRGYRVPEMEADLVYKVKIYLKIRPSRSSPTIIMGELQTLGLKVVGCIRLAYSTPIGRGMEQLEARWVHSPKVAGSSPASATPCQGGAGFTRSSIPFQRSTFPKLF